MGVFFLFFFFIGKNLFWTTLGRATLDNEKEKRERTKEVYTQKRGDLHTVISLMFVCFHAIHSGRSDALRESLQHVVVVLSLGLSLSLLLFPLVLIAYLTFWGPSFFLGGVGEAEALSSH